MVCSCRGQIRNTFRRKMSETTRNPTSGNHRYTVELHTHKAKPCAAISQCMYHDCWSLSTEGNISNDTPYTLKTATACNHSKIQDASKMMMPAN